MRTGLKGILVLVALLVSLAGGSVPPHFVHATTLNPANTQTRSLAPSGPVVPAGANTATTITDLGALCAGCSSAAEGINDTGQMVGVSYITSDYSSATALFWQSASSPPTVIGPLCDGCSSRAERINHAGQIVGGISVPAASYDGPALWQSASGPPVPLACRVQDSPCHDAISADGINKLGQVVGQADYFYASGVIDHNPLHAALWQSGSSSPIDLGALCDGCVSEAKAINDAGQVVGDSNVALGDPLTHAVLWQSGSSSPIDLGALCDGCDSYAYGINNVGQVVGYSDTTADHTTQAAVLWQSASSPPIKLSALCDGCVSYAYGINNLGQVVGNSNVAPGGHLVDAVLWQAWQGGTPSPPSDLGALCTGCGGEAQAINDAGQVVGSGGTATGQHAVLWQVVPLLKQGGPSLNAQDASGQWGGETYDSETQARHTPCGTTIGQCGCYITGSAMALEYFGVKVPATLGPPVVAGGPVTPRNLNAWLTDNDGYTPITPANNPGTYSGADLIPNAVADFSRAMGGPHVQPVRINGFDMNQAQQYIENGMPVLLLVRHGHHWVVAYGIYKSTLLINDPGYPRTTLADPAYGNTATAMVVFQQTQSDFASMEIAVTAPAQVLVTDPSGNQTGFSPANGAIVQNIPSSAYYFEGDYEDPTGQNPAPPPDAGVNRLIIETPQAGQYQLELSGPPGGTWYASIFGSDHTADAVVRNLQGQFPASGLTTLQPTYDPTSNSPIAAVSAAVGWNLVDLPLTWTTPVSASTILQGVLQNSGGSLTAIFALQNNHWSAPLLLQRGGQPVGTDFTLQPGVGYLLYSDQVGSYLQTGTVPPNQPTWTLTSGWNLVGPSLGATGPISASTVLQGVLQNSGGNLTAIFALHDNRWSSPLLLQRGGSPTGTDFALQPGQGYLLYTDAGASYTPGTAAAGARRRTTGSGPTTFVPPPGLPAP